KLACRTALGAGRMLVESGRSAAELREQVTSPGGTTQAALEILMAEGGLANLMRRTVAAAAKKARELRG
ncbi:MAG: pyrroline-5-carboxylate reductase, partial [Alphaproteobacteria bacterium]